MYQQILSLSFLKVCLLIAGASGTLRALAHVTRQLGGHKHTGVCRHPTTISEHERMHWATSDHGDSCSPSWGDRNLRVLWRFTCLTLKFGGLQSLISKGSAAGEKVEIASGGMTPAGIFCQTCTRRCILLASRADGAGRIRIRTREQGGDNGCLVCTSFRVLTNNKFKGFLLHMYMGAERGNIN